MIKTLQKKFVFSTMIIVTALMIVMLAAINITNFASTKQEILRDLDDIVEYESSVFSGKPGFDLNLPFVSGHMGNIRYFYSEETTSESTDSSSDETSETESSAELSANNDERDSEKPELQNDVVLSSAYFVVNLDLYGNVLETNVEHIASVSEDEADTMAAQVFQDQSSSGVTGKYYYQITYNRFGNSVSMVFLDSSTRHNSFLKVLLFSCIVGLVCWGLMFLIAFLLSKKAIGPIAENIERQKQFVTNAGHELKTPLAIILANTEAMELFNGENKWSRNIKDQVHRLTGMTVDMLALAKMDESSAAATAEDFSLSEIVNNAVETFTSPMELKSITIEKDISDDVTLHATKHHIEMLVSILFDNATKYTNEGGTFSISLSKNGKKTILKATNTVDELPTVQPKKLFDRFVRGDESHTQKTGGQGIGLSAALTIVENNKGAIKAEYGEDPKTVSFIVTF